LCALATEERREAEREHDAAAGRIADLPDEAEIALLAQRLEVDEDRRQQLQREIAELERHAEMARENEGLIREHEAETIRLTSAPELARVEHARLEQMRQEGEQARADARALLPQIQTEADLAAAIPDLEQEAAVAEALEDAMRLKTATL